MHEYSLSILIQKIKASSRALRNSDYVDPDLKKEILNQITRGWRHISTILFALSPILAEQGSASFGGQNFILSGNFGTDFEEIMENILISNPINVVNIFKYDLFSEKISPLLFDGLNSESDELTRHFYILFLVSELPRGWKKKVEDYIIRLNKNSFYLLNTLRNLEAMYKYGFISKNELNNIKSLLKLGYAKHEFGTNIPSIKDLRKIVLPERKTQT